MKNNIKQVVEPIQNFSSGDKVAVVHDPEALLARHLNSNNNNIKLKSYKQWASSNRPANRMKRREFSLPSEINA